MPETKPYDSDICDQICNLIATTHLSLEKIMARLKKPISPRTWYRWLEESDDCRQKSARAREEQAHYLADRAVQEAFAPRRGKIIKKVTNRIVSKGTVDDGEPEKDEVEITETISDNVERSKLIVQTIYRRAGQLYPKVYAERNIQMGDPENPIAVKIDREELLAKLIGNRGTAPATSD